MLGTTIARRVLLSSRRAFTPSPLSRPFSLAGVTLPQSSVGPVIPSSIAMLMDRKQVEESEKLMKELVEELNGKLDKVREGGGEGAVERLRKREKVRMEENRGEAQEPRR